MYFAGFSLDNLSLMALTIGRTSSVIWRTAKARWKRRWPAPARSDSPSYR
jgi:hypothetical protein